MGYPIRVDGRYGPATTDAVAAFQRANNIRVDGIAGDVTLATIDARLAGLAAPIGQKADAVAVPQEVAGGTAISGVGGVGEQLIEKSDLLQPYTTLSDIIGYICAGMITVGLLFVLYGVVKTYVLPAIRKRTLPVPA